MSKKMAMILACTLAGSSLNAADMSIGEKFIGIEVGAAKIQADTLLTPDYKGSDVEFGVRIGAQNESWRTMLIFDYFDSEDDDQNYEKALFELDYTLFTSKTDDISFRPYLGLNVGYMNYESTNIDEDGFLYGGQAGFIVGLTESVDLDVMYRYSFTDAANTDHIESWVVGFNYFY